MKSDAGLGAMATSSQNACKEATAVVKLRRVISNFRASLQKDASTGGKAGTWFRRSMTPRTFASPTSDLWGSPAFFDSEGRLQLFTLGSAESFSLNPGVDELYISMEQVAYLKQRLEKAGVAAANIEAAWTTDWEQGPKYHADVTKVALSPEQWAQYVAVRGELVRSRKESLVLKRPFDPSSDAHFLPTPSPSQESSPEPVLAPKKARSSFPAVTARSVHSHELVLATAFTTPLSPTTSASNTPTSRHPRAYATPEAIAAALVASQLKDAATLHRISQELEMLRDVYNSRKGKATFIAIDFETYEFQHDLITEAGWASVSIDRMESGVQMRRETQHAVVEENQRFRNKRFAPDARDHFDYGKSLIFPQEVLSDLLHALVDTYSSSGPLFVLFHDSRADIRTLHQLGFAKGTFSRPSGNYGNQTSGCFVVDTQQLFQGWIGQRRQFKLSKCCEDLEVEVLRPHNAGNDAHYTLGLFERMMDRDLRPLPESDASSDEL